MNDDTMKGDRTMAESNIHRRKKRKIIVVRQGPLYPFPVYFRLPLSGISSKGASMGISTVIKDYGTEILNAIRENDLKALKAILEKHLKADHKIAKLCVTDIKHRPTKKFACPLILAARQEDPRILNYMLVKGADPNFIHHTIYSSKRREIVTALHIAADLGFYDTVETLLNANADCNIADHNQETPLHIAVKKADRIMTRMMLSHGANPNVLDRRGNAALHIATLYGHLQMVRALLKYDADVYQQGQWGAIAPQIAAKEGHIHLIQLFCSRDVGNINIKISCYPDKREKAPIHLAAEHGHVQTVLTLLDQFEAEVNLKDSDGNTPLHCVVLNPYDPHRMSDEKYFTESARVLIINRVSINEKNNFGDSALHLAAMNHFRRIVEMLLEVGANPFAENEENLKPIDVVPDTDPVTKQLLKNAMLNPKPPVNVSTLSLHRIGDLSFAQLPGRQPGMGTLHENGPFQTSTLRSNDPNANMFPRNEPQNLSFRSVSSMSSVFVDDVQKARLAAQQRHGRQGDAGQNPPDQGAGQSGSTGSQGQEDATRNVYHQIDHENEIPVYTKVDKDKKKKAGGQGQPDSLGSSKDTMQSMTKEQIIQGRAIIHNVNPWEDDSFVTGDIDDTSFDADPAWNKQQKLKNKLNKRQHVHQQQLEEAYIEEDSNATEEVFQEEPPAKPSKHKKDTRSKRDPRQREERIYENIEMDPRRTKPDTFLDKPLPPEPQPLEPYQQKGVHITHPKQRPGLIEVQYSGGPITISVDTATEKDDPSHRRLGAGKQPRQIEHQPQTPILKEIQPADEDFELDEQERRDKKKKKKREKERPEMLYANQDMLQEMQDKQKVKHKGHAKVPQEEFLEDEEEEPPPLPHKTNRQKKKKPRYRDDNEQDEEKNDLDQYVDPDEEYDDQKGQGHYYNQQGQYEEDQYIDMEPATPQKEDISGVINGTMNITETETQSEFSIESQPPPEEVRKSIKQKIEDMTSLYKQKWHQDDPKPGELPETWTRYDLPAEDDHETPTDTPSKKKKRKKEKRSKKDREEPEEYKQGPIEYEEEQQPMAEELGVTQETQDPTSPQYKSFAEKKRLFAAMLAEQDQTSPKPVRAPKPKPASRPQPAPRNSKAKLVGTPDSQQWTVNRAGGPAVVESTGIFPQSSYNSGGQVAAYQERSSSEDSDADSESSSGEEEEAAPVLQQAREHPQPAHEKFYSITPDPDSQENESDASSTQGTVITVIPNEPKASEVEHQIKLERVQGSEKTSKETLPCQNNQVEVVTTQAKAQQASNTHQTEDAREELMEYGEEPGSRRRPPPEAVVSPVNFKDILGMRSPSYSTGSHSPSSSFLSEGSRLNMRVKGNVPKAYTRGQKDSARRAWMQAPPVGIESGSEASDTEGMSGSRNALNRSRTSLTETSPPNPTEEGLRRHSEWTEALKPVTGSTNTQLSPNNVPLSPPPTDSSSDESKGKKNAKLIGSYAKPYKSFGKIETKTDMIDEFMQDIPEEDMNENILRQFDKDDQRLPEIGSITPPDVRISTGSPQMSQAQVLKPQAVKVIQEDKTVYPTVIISPRKKESEDDDQSSPVNVTGQSAFAVVKHDPNQDMQKPQVLPLAKGPPPPPEKVRSPKSVSIREENYNENGEMVETITTTVSTGKAAQAITITAQDVIVTQSDDDDDDDDDYFDDDSFDDDSPEEVQVLKKYNNEPGSQRKKLKRPTEKPPAPPTSKPPPPPNSGLPDQLEDPSNKEPILGPFRDDQQQRSVQPTQAEFVPGDVPLKPSEIKARLHQQQQEQQQLQQQKQQQQQQQPKELPDSNVEERWQDEPYDYMTTYGQKPSRQRARLQSIPPRPKLPANFHAQNEDEEQQFPQKSPESDGKTSPMQGIEEYDQEPGSRRKQPPQSGHLQRQSQNAPYIVEMQGVQEYEHVPKESGTGQQAPGTNQTLQAVDEIEEYEQEPGARHPGPRTNNQKNLGPEDEEVAEISAAADAKKTARKAKRRKKKELEAKAAAEQALLAAQQQVASTPQELGEPQHGQILPDQEYPQHGYPQEGQVLPGHGYTQPGQQGSHITAGQMYPPQGTNIFIDGEAEVTMITGDGQLQEPLPLSETRQEQLRTPEGKESLSSVPSSPATPEGYGIHGTVMGGNVERNDTVKRGQAGQYSSLKRAKEYDSVESLDDDALPLDASQLAAQEQALIAAQSQHAVHVQRPKQGQTGEDAALMAQMWSEQQAQQQQQPTAAQFSRLPNEIATQQNRPGHPAIKNTQGQDQRQIEETNLDDFEQVSDYQHGEVPVQIPIQEYEETNLDDLPSDDHSFQNQAIGQIQSDLVQQPKRQVGRRGKGPPPNYNAQHDQQLAGQLWNQQQNQPGQEEPIPSHETSMNHEELADEPRRRHPQPKRAIVETNIDDDIKATQIAGQPVQEQSAQLPQSQDQEFQDAAMAAVLANSQQQPKRQTGRRAMRKGNQGAPAGFPGSQQQEPQITSLWAEAQKQKDAFAEEEQMEQERQRQAQQDVQAKFAEMDHQPADQDQEETEELGAADQQMGQHEEQDDLPLGDFSRNQKARVSQGRRKGRRRQMEKTAESGNTEPQQVAAMSQEQAALDSMHANLEQQKSHARRTRPQALHSAEDDTQQLSKLWKQRKDQEEEMQRVLQSMSGPESMDVNEPLPPGARGPSPNMTTYPGHQGTESYGPGQPKMPRVTTQTPPGSPKPSQPPKPRKPVYLKSRPDKPPGGDPNVQSLEDAALESLRSDLQHQKPQGSPSRVATSQPERASGIPGVYRPAQPIFGPQRGRSQSHTKTDDSQLVSDMWAQQHKPEVVDMKPPSGTPPRGGHKGQRPSTSSLPRDIGRNASSSPAGRPQSSGSLPRDGHHRPRPGSGRPRGYPQTDRHRPHSVNDIQSDSESFRDRKRPKGKSISFGEIPRSRRGRNGAHSETEMYDLEPPMQAQPGKTLQEAALESIKAGLKDQKKITPRRMVNLDQRKPINFTRGIYRPSPVTWRGSTRSSGDSSSRYDDSQLISSLWAERTRSVNTDTEGEADNEDVSGYHGDASGYADGSYHSDSYMESPRHSHSGQYPQGYLPGPTHSTPEEGQNKENVGHPGGHPTPTGLPPVPHSPRRVKQDSHGKKRRKRRKEKPDKPPMIHEPLPVDFSQYPATAKLWMEQVDQNTVKKSKTMYLSVVPEGTKMPDEFYQKMPDGKDGDTSFPSQWVIARGRTLREKKRMIDEARRRSQGASDYNTSGGESDYDGDRPMSPGRQLLLFFRVGGNWHDLAWVLFDGIQGDEETISMIKDIQRKNPKSLTDMVHDLMHRWWRRKGEAATIEELQRALEVVRMFYIEEQYVDEGRYPRVSRTSFTESEGEVEDLNISQIEDGDPEVSRLIQEYQVRSLNASFDVAGALRNMENQPGVQPDRLTKHLYGTGLVETGSPTATINRDRMTSNRDSLGRTPSSSSQQPGLNTQDLLDYESDTDRRRSFVIVQPQLKTEEYKHETAI